MPKGFCISPIEEEEFLQVLGCLDRVIVQASGRAGRALVYEAMRSLGYGTAPLRVTKMFAMVCEYWNIELSKKSRKGGKEKLHTQDPRRATPTQESISPCSPQEASRIVECLLQRAAPKLRLLARRAALSGEGGRGFSVDVLATILKDAAVGMPMERFGAEEIVQQAILWMDERAYISLEQDRCWLLGVPVFLPVIT